MFFAHRLCLCLILACSIGINLAAEPLESKGVSFAASSTIAPYFYPEQPGGIQYELLKYALDTGGMHISHVELAPNKRALRLTLARKTDCLVNAPEGITGLYYTRSLNEYQNSVFTLASSELAISSIEDLNNMSLLGFQNATRYLGKEFSDMAKQHKGYLEVANQQSQIIMLFTNRVQAVVLEREIFAYYRRLLRHKVDTSQPVTEQQLFSPAPRRLACRNPELAKRIDKAIATFRLSPQYHEILNKITLTNDQ